MLDGESLKKYSNNSQDVIAKLHEYGNLILKSKNALEGTQYLKEAYKLVKIITYFYFREDKKDDLMKIMHALSDIESYASNRFYIMDTTPLFDYEEARCLRLKGKSPEEIVDFIVKSVRKELMEEYNELLDFKNLKLINKCKDATNIVKILCDSLDIECASFRINPGFLEENAIENQLWYHYFAIIKIQDKMYIVDCAYRQFFLLGENVIEKLGIITSNCYPGVYMLMNKARKQVAQAILKKGYVEIGADTLKNYLDGFALSFRNGLFYEKRGVAQYTTPYEELDYIKFLSQIDNQVNHEGLEVLGRQRVPLKNPNFKF